MTNSWTGKICFKMHWIAWHGIRWSIKRCMRSMGYDLTKLASNWDPVVVMDGSNRLHMEWCAEDLRAARHLIKEQHLAELASRQPSLVHDWLARDQEKAHRMVGEAVRKAQQAQYMDKEASHLLQEMKNILASKEWTMLKNGQDPKSTAESSRDQKKEAPGVCITEGRVAHVPPLTADKRTKQNEHKATAYAAQAA